MWCVRSQTDLCVPRGVCGCCVPGGPRFSVPADDVITLPSGSPSPASTVAALQALFSSVSATLHNGVSAGLAATAARLIKQCQSGLSNVASISTAYRMTGKPVPTKPSLFVPKLVKPLQDFLRNQGGPVLQPR